MDDDYTPEQKHKDEGWFLVFEFAFIILMVVVTKLSGQSGFHIFWGILFATAAGHWLVVAMVPRLLTRWKRYRHLSILKARRF